MLRRTLGRPFPFVRSTVAGGVRPARPRSPRARSATAVGGRLAAAGRSVCRKYRKASIRRLQQQEYDKLCRIVPALATRRHRRRISKVTVVEETIRYIDELHKALAAKLQSKTGQRDVTVAEAADTARRTFLEVESAALDRRVASSPPHQYTSSAVAAAAAAAGTVAPHTGREGELRDRVPSMPSEELPSR